MFKTPFHFLALTLSLATLPACVALVPATVAQLEALDPLTVDPAQIDLALILPQGVDTQRGSARLVLEAQNLSPDGNEQAREVIVLQERPATVVGFGVPQGAQAKVFRIAETDWRRMRAFQARVAEWKAAAGPGRSGSGSFNVSVSGCRLGDGPTSEAVASILIRAGEGRDFQPLIREASLRKVFGPVAFAALLPCDGAQ